MTIISPHDKNSLIDGRQSERAMSIRRGVQRLLRDFRFSMLPELTLVTGRRTDIIAVGEKGEIWIIEIKSSIEDFKVDNKWPEYRDYCDRLFFATLQDVPQEIFPEDCGFIVADNFGGHMLREAPEHKLLGGRRKSLMLRFARTAADRLLVAEIAANPI
jgi:hypothetical protein